MGFAKLLKKIFGTTASGNTIAVYLQDKKCGRKIKVLLRKSYDIQRIYEEDKDAAYMVNKVVVCDKCFNRIEINLKFDRRYKIISRDIKGGKFLQEEEYNKEKNQ